LADRFKILRASITILLVGVSSLSPPCAQASISVETANEILNRVAHEFRDWPKRYGGKFVLSIVDEKLPEYWADKRPAKEVKDVLDWWVILPSTGVLAVPEVDRDLFTLMTCHEFGHLLGGFPYSRNGLAFEGQADYFASQVCLKRIWRRENEANDAAGLVLPAPIRNDCDLAWQSAADRALCYRISKTALESGGATRALFKHFGLRPGNFHGIDSLRNVGKPVEYTNENHPNINCRVRTLLNGALCSVEFDEGNIPGLDLLETKDIQRMTEAAHSYACHASPGSPFDASRPSCWYIEGKQ
jgi:hypothetical protein